MAHWNYRLVRYADGQGFGVHEVYYDDDGNPLRMTADAVRFTADTAEEVREAILLAHTDTVRRSVFDEPPEWAAVGD